MTPEEEFLLSSFQDIELDKYLEGLNGLLNIYNTPYSIVICELPYICNHGTENEENINVGHVILIPLKQNNILSIGGKKFEIICTIFNGKKFLESKKITYKDIKNKDCLYEHWGYRDIGLVSKEAYDHMQNIFYSFANHVEVEDIYTFTGWHNDSTFIFGNLKIDGNDVTPVKSNAISTQLTYDESMTETECCQFLVDVFLNVTNNGVYSRVILSFLVLGLCISRFIRYSDTIPSFALAIIGKTGSRKTSSALAMLNPMRIINASFCDSASAVKTKIKSNNDCVSIIDDMKPDNMECAKEIFKEVISLAGDKNANGDKMVGNKVETSSISSLFACTGEELPSLAESSYPRILILSYDNDTVDNNILTQLQDNQDKFIAAIIRIIQYIINFDSGFEESIVGLVRDARNKVLQSDNSIHGRYIDMYAWLTVIWQFITECCKKYGVSLPSDNFEGELSDLIVKQHKVYSQKDASFMFLSAFFHLFDSNEFITITYQEAKDDKSFDVIEMSEKYFIKSGNVYKKVLKYYKQEDINFPFTEGEVRKDLEEKGLKEITNNAKNITTIEFKTSSNHSKSGFYLLVNRSKNYIGGLDNE